MLRIILNPIKAGLRSYFLGKDIDTGIPIDLQVDNRIRVKEACQPNERPDFNSVFQMIYEENEKKRQEAIQRSIFL